MTRDVENCKSWLFVPGDSERKIAKVPASTTDAIIFDLEDSVSPDNKAAARTLVLRALQDPDNRLALTCVRVNPFDTGMTADDVSGVIAGKPDALMLPKLLTATELHDIDRLLSELESQHNLPLGSTALIALVSETPQMTLELPSLSDVPERLKALTWGAEDLATELGARTNKNADGSWRFSFELARSLCLLAARRNDLLALDTVYTDFGNDNGLTEYARRASEDGFDGMLAIHPKQVDTINAAFAPSPADLERAKAIVAAFAEQPGAGVVRLGSEMLDEPHRKQAERVLKRSNS